MKKRAAIEIFAVVSFLVITGSLIAGSYIITQDTTSGNMINSEITHKYIGNLETKYFYDINCQKYIDEEKRIFFKSFNEAIKIGFKYNTSCQDG